MGQSFTLAIATGAVLLVSTIANPHKTAQGVRKGVKMLVNLLLPFLSVIILVSVVLALLPQETLIRYLGKESGLVGFVTAATVGSIALIPGFVVYPLSAILRNVGVSYQVIAVFITTLMMVGVVTLPIEIKCFGTKVSILRNGLSFVGAVLIGYLMGWIL